MAAEMDPRLVGLLRASLGFVDALRDIGVLGQIAVSLDAQGGASLQRLVETTGNQARLAGLAFDWPEGHAPRPRAANDNVALAMGGETPALR